jgi:hypothetical protein
MYRKVLEKGAEKVDIKVLELPFKMKEHVYTLPIINVRDLIEEAAHSEMVEIAPQDVISLYRDNQVGKLGAAHSVIESAKQFGKNVEDLLKSYRVKTQGDELRRYTIPGQAIAFFNKELFEDIVRETEVNCDSITVDYMVLKESARIVRAQQPTSSSNIAAEDDEGPQEQPYLIFTIGNKCIQFCETTIIVGKTVIPRHEKSDNFIEDFKLILGSVSILAPLLKD